MTVHKEFELDLPAYVASRLDASAHRRMEDHLRDCESCREMAVTFRDYGQTLRDGGAALFEPHPSESTLRHYASALDPAGDQGVTRHLEVCASCSLEVGLWRRRAPIPGTAAPRLIGRSAAVPSAEAPYVAVALGWRSIGLASAVGMVVGFGLALLLRVGAPSSSVGPLLALPRILRGEDSAVRYTLDPGRTYVPVACPAPIPENAAPQELFRYEIRKAGLPPDKTGQSVSAIVWSQTMSAAEIRRHLTMGSEVVILLVSTDSLAPGLYEFRLSPAAGAGGPLYRARLEFTGSA